MGILENRVLRLVAIIPALVAALVVGSAAFDVSAAPVRFKPLTLSQPDGSPVSLFITGDEFYRYLHDENGYPIVRDDEGWLVYVQERGVVPVPSTVPAGTSDPFLYGIFINPGPPDLPEVMSERIRASRQLYERPRVLTPRVGGPYRGKINELVIFVRFDGEDEFVDDVSFFDGTFNDVQAGDVSLRSYFKEVSYGKMEVEAHFFPQTTGDGVISYQDSHPRQYFQKYSDRNRIGYEYEQEGMYRLGQMLERAVAFIKPQVSPDLDIDLDNNGISENVTFIVSGTVDDWSDALWPHSYMLLGNQQINGVMLMEYNLQFRDWLMDDPVGVLAHEFFHAIGSPDLYHYSHDGSTPAGPWDLMEWDGTPPQHMTAYMKYNYGRFIDSIPEITTPGRYTLNPLVSPENNCFKIPVPGAKYESFMVEYRKKEGTYEGSIPGSGLLIYRVDRRYGGNANGPPDEVYVMRPGGEPDTDGDIRQAFYSADAGRTEFSESTIPYPYLQNGSPAGIRIYDISAAGDTISFSVCPSVPSCVGIECGDDNCGGSCGSCDDSNDCTVDSCDAGVCVNVPVTDGAVCGLGDMCMEGGQCVEGECIASVPADCHDDQDCTVDLCVDGQKWVDVNEDRFEDILNGGTSAEVNGDDVVSAVINIGFDFPFMGQTMRTFAVYDNGIITLGGSVDPAPTSENMVIPAAAAPANMIAAYWDDMICKLSDRCVVGYATLGQGADRRTVIQWNKLQKFGIPKATMSMQVALFEDGRIELRYKELGGIDGVSATIGFQGQGGSSGYQYSAFRRTLRRGMTLAWSPAEYECRYQPVIGRCLIGGNCVEKGAADPANPCVQCMPIVNGTGWTSDDSNTCSDSSLCTRVDVCRSGVCEGTDKVMCRALDQCHTAGTCAPATGVCDDPVKPDGSGCDADSDGCTRSDSCLEGVCSAGLPVDCSAFEVKCGKGICFSRSSNSYRCQTDKSMASGQACGDGPTVCSGMDTCDESGKCQVNNFGEETVCRPATNQCDVPESCDGAGGCPADEVGPDWTSCGTGEIDAVCLGGSCVATVPGDSCSKAFDIRENKPYVGDLTGAHPYGGASADCPEVIGPDLFFKFIAAAGVDYKVWVAPNEALDVALVVTQVCSQDAVDCDSAANAGGAGMAEFARVSYDAETLVYVRVVKVGNSVAGDFRLTVASTGDAPYGDVVDADADANGTDDAGVIDGGAGCSQSSGQSSDHGAVPVVLIVAFMMLLLAGARRSVGRRQV